MTTHSNEIESEVDLIALMERMDSEDNTQSLGVGKATVGDGMDMAIGGRVISGGGLIVMYSTDTGLSSKVHRNMIPRKVREVRPDGQRAWSFIEPTNPPHPYTKGILFCWLHPQSEWRETADQFGLGTCNKSNLPSPFEQENHVRVGHPHEYGVFNRQREQLEKDQDRELQRGILASLSPQLTTSPKPRKPRGKKTAART